MKMAFAAANLSRTLLLSTTNQRQRAAFSFYKFSLLLHHHPRNYQTRLNSSRQNVVEILKEIGLIESLTSDSLHYPDLPHLRVYCGFDPTTESLHLGNLFSLIILSWFIQCGHQVVALVSGATERITDPSVKSLKRPELDPLSLERNVSAILATIQSILG